MCTHPFCKFCKWPMGDFWLKKSLPLVVKNLHYFPISLLFALQNITFSEGCSAKFFTLMKKATRIKPGIPVTFINMHKHDYFVLLCRRSKKPHLLLGWNVTCWLTGNMTVWESLPLRLAPSLLLTGSLQWISLLCICLLSHCGRRQTCQSPGAASTCLAVHGLYMWVRLLPPSCAEISPFQRKLRLTIVWAP